MSAEQDTTPKRQADISTEELRQEDELTEQRDRETAAEDLLERMEIAAVEYCIKMTHKDKTRKGERTENGTFELTPYDNERLTALQELSAGIDRAHNGLLSHRRSNSNEIADYFLSLINDHERQALRSYDAQRIREAIPRFIQEAKKSHRGFSNDVAVRDEMLKAVTAALKNLILQIIDTVLYEPPDLDAEFAQEFRNIDWDEDNIPDPYHYRRSLEDDFLAQDPITRTAKVRGINFQQCLPPDTPLDVVMALPERVEHACRYVHELLLKEPSPLL